jgi:hypothetical protein
MVKKPCIGFSTQDAAREAIREIVWKYDPGDEFFHPLLQQLFLERPYWCDPPGPRFIRFKWGSKPLPNGIPNDRHFMALSPALGWVSVSFNKALTGKRMTPEIILANFARERVMAITTEFRARHPVCAHCDRPAADVHHTVPVMKILKIAMASLTADQLDEIMDLYLTWRGIQSFTLPDDHPFTEVILKYHWLPGTLISLCKEHHNTAHGKQTHDPRRKNKGSGQEAP